MEAACGTTLSNPSDAEFKTLVVRMLKELNEELNSIKKIQSEKDTLIEIKNNLQRNNSRVDGAENQINDLEHKKEKKKTIRETRRKKNPEKMRIVLAASGTTSRSPTFTS